MHIIVISGLNANLKHKAIVIIVVIADDDNIHVSM